MQTAEVLKSLLYLFDK